MEHRYMFEMKIREKEERKREEEFMKRKWESEDSQNYWMQQNPNMYYGNQQHPMVPGKFCLHLWLTWECVFFFYFI